MIDPNRVHRATPSDAVDADRRRLAEGRTAVAVTILLGEALTLGVNQPEDAASAVRARALGIPVIRRSTGGTSVLTAPGDLAWSIVLPRSDPRVGRDYVRAYARFGRALAEELTERGRPAGWEPAPGLFEELCVLSARGQVLRAAGRIVGGAAQHLTSAALLHHGILAHRIDLHRTAEIFGAPPELLDRELAGWSQVGLETSPEELARTLLLRLRSDLGRTA